MSGDLSPAGAAGGGTPGARAGIRSRGILPWLLGAAVIILYAPLCQFPFVQDDWKMLRQFVFRSALTAAENAATPAGKFFYRPFAWIYCRIMYGAFGLEPLGFHACAIVLLLCSAFLVVSVARALTRDERVAWGSGFVFAAASNIHIDPQMWLVGVFDIGAVFFTLLSVNAFLKKRFGYSALWFAAALGFKESSAMLFFVLAVWVLLSRTGESGAKAAFRNVFSGLRWHAAAFIVLLAAKIPGQSLYALPDTHPYVARILGTHLGTNFQRYALWSLQAVTPLKNVGFSEYGALMTLFLLTAGLVLVFIFAVRHVAGRGKENGGPVVYAMFVLAWFFLMLYPSLTFKHQINRYYLMTALPPLAIGTMLLFKVTMLNAGKSARLMAYATAIFAAVNVIDGGASMYRRAALGAMDGIHASGREGDNNLIRKASTVRSTWKPLLALLPTVPPHSLIVLEGVETGCFVDNDGIQVWYGDSTLTVTGTLPEGPDSLGMVHAVIAVDDFWASRETTLLRTFPAGHTIQVRNTPDGMVLVRNGYRPQ
jgi:hypothetical protein